MSELSTMSQNEKDCKRNSAWKLNKRNKLWKRGFTIQEFENRFAKIQKLMIEHSFDAILVTTESDFRYFSGLVSQFWASPTRPMYLVLPASGSSPIAVVPDIMLESIKTTWIKTVHSWPAPQLEDDGVSLLTSVLKQFCVIGMSMNIECHVRMPLLHLNQIQENLNMTFKDTTHLIRQLRVVKSLAEVEKIESACTIASECFGALPAQLEALGFDHITERRAVKEMHMMLLENGADSVPYIVGKSGKDGYMSVVDGPGDDILTPGSIFTIDTGAVFDGYYCDFNRNYVIKSDIDGKTREYAEENELLWDATQAAIDMAKPGLRFCDIWERMVNVLESHGHDRRHYIDTRIGHCLGLQLTELPSIVHNEIMVLEEGMVIAIEPWLRVGKGIMVHEEVVVVTQDGCRLLSRRAPRAPQIIKTQVTFDPHSVHMYTPMQQQSEISSETKTLLQEFQDQQVKVQRFHASLDPTMTPLTSMINLAKEINVKEILVKDEGHRFGLKSFKGLGGSYAISALDTDPKVLCTMTDGNHGKGVAFAAKRLGMDAIIYVPANMTVPRIEALKELGASVVVVQGSYDDAIEKVKEEAETKGWCLVSDTAWEGYETIPKNIMAGYGTIFREIEEQRAHCSAPITHVLVQAGVGGLAAAAMAWIWLNRNSATWCADIELMIVEPCDADCIAYNVLKQKNCRSKELRSCIGKTDSIMSGLNCGTPSSVSWPIIRDISTQYITIGDGWAKDAMRKMYGEGIVAGESGAAGIAAVMAVSNTFDSNSVVLCINTEADTDPETYREIVFK